MKSTFIILFVSGITFSLIAQNDIINGGFEDTTHEVNSQNSSVDTLVTSWAKRDFGQGVTTDARSGGVAAVIWNWYHYAQGELMNGSGPFLKQGGTPLSFSPTAMTGFYKYIYGFNDGKADSAIAEIWILKYNPTLGKRDTLGYGIGKLGPAAEYTDFRVDITYSNALMPDTVLVRFRSSENGFCGVNSAGNCLYLYVDDIAITDQATSSGIETHAKQQFELYPNPADDFIQVLPAADQAPDKISIAVFNVLGKKVMSREIIFNEDLKMDISSLPCGIYTIQMGEHARKFVKQ